VERLLEGIPAASATIRTTTAVTIFEAGVKDNVIPSRARAVVNFRILPGDSIASVVAHVKRTVDDPRVHVEALPKQREPSPPSVTEGEAWDLLARSIREVHPDAIVTPYLMLAGTDSRHFRGLTEAVYRFMPVRLTFDDTQRIHGTNERISIEGHADGVRFYRRLLENAVR
jgi:carboxypeptidase PM20D1